MSRRRRGPASRVTSHHRPSGRIAAVATALMPLTSATTMAEPAAARRVDPLREPATSGTSSHGARAMGSVSDEIGPSVVSIRADST